MNRFFIFFVLLFLSAPVGVFAAVEISEIAWMGTVVSANDEWIEFFNSGEESIDLSGWTLSAEDGTPDILIDDCLISCVLSPGSFFLLERTDDESVPGVSADFIYTGALSNTGENLVLKNDQGVAVDSIMAADGWPAGDSVARLTMQRNNNIWVTAEATPKDRFIYEDNVDGENMLLDEPAQQLPTGQNSANINDNIAMVVKNIKVFAGNDRTIIAGASEEFEGIAGGLEDEILGKARFLWNFGDGSLKEGNNVAHFYYHPGEYIVSLDVSSGEYSASDRILVKVIPNKITISELRPGVESFIELTNGSGKEINLSYWKFSCEGKTFTFADNTFIASYGYLAVPVFSSGIIFPEGRGLVSLFYSSGLLADEFSYDGYLADGQGFSKGDGGIFVALATPGEKNSFVIKSLPSIVKQAVATVQNYSPEPAREELLAAGQNVSGENVVDDFSEVSLDEINSSANVFSVAKEKSFGGGFYFLLLFLLLLVVGSVVFFIRRKGRV